MIIGQELILFLETTFMEQQKKMVIHQIHFIHGGGLLRLLRMVAIMCAMLMAMILVRAVAALLAIAAGFRCLPVFHCSVADV